MKLFLSKLFSILCLFLPLALIAFAVWAWISPTAEEIAAGADVPPLAMEAQRTLAKYAIGSSQDMAVRAKIHTALTDERVIAVDKYLKDAADTVYYWTNYVLGRIIEIKLGYQRGWGRFFITLLIGVPACLLLYLAGIWLLSAHIAFTGTMRAMTVYKMTVSAGCLMGLGYILPASLDWHLVPMVWRAISFVLIGLSLLLAVIDVFKANFLTLLLLVCGAYGFVIGVVMSNILVLLAFIGFALLFMMLVLYSHYYSAMEPYVKKTAKLTDGTELTRIVGSDEWEDSSGNRYKQTSGDMFERKC